MANVKIGPVASETTPYKHTFISYILLQIERNRVLEEALAALARTHHALEMSVAEELTKVSNVCGTLFYLLFLLLLLFS